MLPDVIISDIMMPHIDGITLMSMIKEDVLLSHIPVILISARTSQSIFWKAYAMMQRIIFANLFDNEYCA